MTQTLDMAGKVVIVTGGGRGVGKGITECFLAAGADVVICGRNEPKKLPEADGRRAHFTAADVREVEQIKRGFPEVLPNRNKWGLKVLMFDISDK